MARVADDARGSYRITPNVMSTVVITFRVMSLGAPRAYSARKPRKAQPPGCDARLWTSEYARCAIPYRMRSVLPLRRASETLALRAFA